MCYMQCVLSLLSLNLNLFVTSAKRISPGSVKGVFRLKPSECSETVTIFCIVQKYIENSSEEGCNILIDAFKVELINPLAKHLNAGSIICSLC